MWQKFPGFLSLDQRDNADIADLHFSFVLECDVASQEYGIAVWRDLLFRAGPGRLRPTDFRPISAAELKAFQTRLHSLGLTTWKRVYDPVECYGVNFFDGWDWQLFVRFPERSYRSSGNNAFPRGFRELCATLDNLVHLEGFSAAAERAQTGVEMSVRRRKR
jgi:hypothetical protein